MPGGSSGSASSSSDGGVRVSEFLSEVSKWNKNVERASFHAKKWPWILQYGTTLVAYYNGTLAQIAARVRAGDKPNALNELAKGLPALYAGLSRNSMHTHVALHGSAVTATGRAVAGRVVGYAAAVMIPPTVLALAEIWKLSNQRKSLLERLGRRVDEAKGKNIDLDEMLHDDVPPDLEMLLRGGNVASRVLKPSGPESSSIKHEHLMPAESMKTLGIRLARMAGLDD